MLLEDAGWTGMRHFDAHPYRTEDHEGVWDFARGCMRTYLILRQKVRRFHDDAEIAEALRTARRSEIDEPTSPGGLGTDALAALRASVAATAEEPLATYGYGHERLDQLVTELLLGTR
jgi:xylose isomerase